MSFVFRGSRGDIETGFPDFIPERRAVRLNAAGRPPNSVTFLVTVLLLFMILNSQQMSPNILLWLLLGVFLLTTGLRMYATCQQLRAQAHAAAAASGLLGHNELRLHVPPSLAFVTRGHLQSLRLQLALLDREFDNLDDIVSRSLESDGAPDVPSMTEEQINTLPVHKYNVQSQHGAASGQTSDGSLQQQTSSSSMIVSEKKQGGSSQEGSSKITEDELTCSICLDQVNTGDLLRTLPCLHQAGSSESLLLYARLACIALEWMVVALATFPNFLVNHITICMWHVLSTVICVHKYGLDHRLWQCTGRVQLDLHPNCFTEAR